MIEATIVSRQGEQRERNQDYASYHVGERYEFWIIGDGATNAFRSGEYIATFAGNLLSHLKQMSDAVCDREAIDNAIKVIHDQLRREFVCAKASFLLLVIDRHNVTQHCFYSGDCRIGTLANGSIEWLNLPHNLVVANGIREEQPVCSLPERNTLFQRLIGKRYTQPDYQRLQLDLALPVVLATDGFWCNFPLLLPDTLSEDSLREHLGNLALRNDDMTIVVRLFMQ